MSERFSSATAVNPTSNMYLHAIRPDQPAPITVTSLKTGSGSDILLNLIYGGKQNRPFEILSQNLVRLI